MEGSKWEIDQIKKEIDEEAFKMTNFPEMTDIEGFKNFLDELIRKLTSELKKRSLR